MCDLLPFRASLHFHSGCKAIQKMVPDMCQCPFGLLFISTAQRKEAIMMDSSVSMPIRASLHFHVVTVKGQPVNVVSCQYPFGLLFISTIPVRYIAWFLTIMCQCPFGLFFISTWKMEFAFMVEMVVSMPFWAFLHFYSILLEPAETKHFPGLFCRYLSENSENKVFQIVFCTVHNLFIF